MLCVVLLHIQIHMPQEQSLLASMLPQTLFNIVFRSGYYGVIIFFVISGFLVTRSALERWGSWMPCPGAPSCCGARRASYPCLLLLLIVLAALRAGRAGFVIETTSLARAALAALGMHLNWLEARTGYLPAAWACCGRCRWKRRSTWRFRCFACWRWRRENGC